MPDFNRVKPFRFWCQKVLPLDYNDSLSYYELLNKVVDYLNKTIKDVNSVIQLTEDFTEEQAEAYAEFTAGINQTVEELTSAFNTLHDFVDGYFENLDVQEEIDNKLDEMAIDGTLTNMVRPVAAGMIPELVAQWLEENITPTTPAVDRTLSITGAAADAREVGYRLAWVGDSYSWTDNSQYYPLTGDITANQNYARTARVKGNINEIIGIRAISGTADAHCIALWKDGVYAGWFTYGIVSGTVGYYYFAVGSTDPVSYVEHDEYAISWFKNEDYPNYDWTFRRAKLAKEVTDLKEDVTTIESVIPSTVVETDVSSSLVWVDDKIINIQTGNVISFDNYSYAVVGAVKQGEKIYCGGLRGIGKSRAITLISSDGIQNNHCVVLAYAPNESGYFTGEYIVPQDGIIIVTTHKTTKQNVVVHTWPSILQNTASNNDVLKLSDTVDELLTYTDFISPSESLIDFNDLTSGYINGTGGINTPSTTNKEKTSQIIPINVNHTYYFVSSVPIATGQSWLAVGFWDSNDVFLGRPSAISETVDETSTAILTIKPSNSAAYARAAYMRISWRSFGLQNVSANDVTFENKTIYNTIINTITGKDKTYHIKGADIDVSKKGYDIAQMAFAPVEESGKYTQGMAISNNTIFQGFGNGTIDLYNTDTGTLINSFNASAGHCGSLSFSDAYPDGNTAYPELYVASFTENKTFVFNITDASITLNRTYLLPTDQGGYCQETCYDKVSKTLWCVGHKNNSYEAGGYLIVTQWDLSRTTEDNGFLIPTLLKTFDIPWIYHLQCVQTLNGQLFMVFGGDGSADNLLTRIFVIDTGNNAIKTIIDDFTDAIKAAEPEGIDFVFDNSTFKYYGVLVTRRAVKYYKLLF